MPPEKNEDLVLSGLAFGHDLLQVMELNPARLRPKAKPLMVEFGVNPETAPFLVTSTRATMWITPRTPTVRAAVRSIPDTGTLFREMVNEIAETGRGAQWGNTPPLTAEGLLAGLAYLHSYDLADVELLAHADTVWPEGARMLQDEAGNRTVGGCPVQVCPWLEPGTVVMLPVDRAYVGFVLLLGEERGLAVVHNASRGVVVLA